MLAVYNMCIKDFNRVLIALHSMTYEGQHIFAPKVYLCGHKSNISLLISNIQRSDAGMDSEHLIILPSSVGWTQNL